MVTDHRLSGSNNSENDRRMPHYYYPKSRGRSARMNRRDLLLVEELSSIGEAYEEFSSIGSSSTTNRQPPSAALVNCRVDDDHINGPGRNQQLNPCPVTTEVVWSPEEKARTTHPKGGNSVIRWVFNRSVRAIIESFQPRMSTSSIVNKATAPENEEEEECVGEWSPKNKEEYGENGEQNSWIETKNVAFVVSSPRGAITSWRKEKKGCCCSLYQSSRFFRASIFVSVALLLCSIALLGITISVRNKGNLQQHHGSASPIRRGPTLPPSTWSDSSPATTTIYPSLYPSNMQSSMPSDAPSLLPSHAPSSISPTSESTQISSLAAPSYVPSGIPSISGVPSLDQSISSTKPAALLPTATDIFIGPGPPEVNWPF